MKTENSNTKPEYYGYFVTHAYMSQIQRGIQSAHVIQAMYKKYAGQRNHASNVFRDWMKKDRTMIVLNGGNSAMIKASVEKAIRLDEEGKYPIASFCEDDQSMEGMTTGWGIVLPKVNSDEYEYDEVYGCYTDAEGYGLVGASKIYMEVLSHLKLA